MHAGDGRVGGCELEDQQLQLEQQGDAGPAGQRARVGQQVSLVSLVRQAARTGERETHMTVERRGCGCWRGAEPWWAKRRGGPSDSTREERRTGGVVGHPGERERRSAAARTASSEGRGGSTTDLWTRQGAGLEVVEGRSATRRGTSERVGFARATVGSTSQRRRPPPAASPDRRGDAPATCRGRMRAGGAGWEKKRGGGQRPAGGVERRSDTPARPGAAAGVESMRRPFALHHVTSSHLPPPGSHLAIVARALGRQLPLVSSATEHSAGSALCGPRRGTAA